MSELQTRKSPRLKGYDYSKSGAYFVTICVKGKHEMLGQIVGADGNPPGNSKSPEMRCSEYGNIVMKEILNIPNIRKECMVDKFVVMPNHVHIIVQILGADGNPPGIGNCPEADIGQPMDNVVQRADCHPPLRRSVSNMVQGLKGVVSRQIGFSMWQRSFHDRIIRSHDEYQRIWHYIDQNPSKWEDDCFYVPPIES